MLELETWPVERLTGYDKNPRKNDAVVDQMVASIKEFGFRIPIVAQSDGLVCDGHLRLKAAISMGMTEVPVVLADELSEAQIKAFRLTANRSANWAEWDDALLSAELQALADADFDIDLIGFDDAEIHRLLGQGDGATDPDDVPPVPEVPVSRLGDIWIMGDHRIICGSSTDPDDVAAVLAGARPHLMVTDPPYGVEYDANWRNESARHSTSGMGNRAIGAGAVGKVMNDDRCDWREAWALFPGDVSYVWCASLHVHEVADSLVASGIDLRSQIIWAKQQFAIGRGDYHWQHEPCWYGVRKGKKGHWQGSRKETTIWEIDKPQKSETGHSTQKPIECMQRPIENNSKVGDSVYDPFSGSGTTIIAGQITGRKVYAIELNPGYVDVSVRRWQAFSEAEATLESTGQTFAQVQAERLA